MGDPCNDSIAIASSIACTEAEGPLRRYALWVRGCSLRCPGCCNPELFEHGGPLTPIAACVAAIDDARRRHQIEGITILGGEPLEQLEPVARLCAAVQRLGLGVIVFTGFTVAQARALPAFDRLWSSLDTLVDGRFDASLRERGADRRRYVGSRNQTLIHRTPRYDRAAWWSGSAVAEVQIDAAGRLCVHGTPDLVALARRRLGDGPR